MLDSSESPTATAVTAHSASPGQSRRRITQVAASTRITRPSTLRGTHTDAVVTTVRLVSSIMRRPAPAKNVVDQRIRTTRTNCNDKCP